MALRLARSAFVASRMNAARSLLPVRGGGGGPLPPPVAPSEPVRGCDTTRYIVQMDTAGWCTRLFLPTQLPEQDEMTWDDGTGNPEHCLDWQKNTGGMTPVRY